MRENAFTLVELLAVLVILAIIASITFPAINGVIKSSRQKAQEAQETQIIKAAKEYYLDHVNDLPEMNGTSTSCVVVDTLKGYMAQDEIKNLETNQNVSGCVIVKYQSNQYVYEYKNSGCACG